ncbi:SpaA isopeptide-forming pilin-related protein [Lacticaseibacillus rhamnosus]|uniref:SpaA isopeptide-forming pilin-related protein n=1 Tax=Lacticaseibacillus rhamnosus TaxID=47715 RepID=UPI002550A989|nr:SpaA isopeptide-forming pilin-related protein [Lacticaseibacillus rhamnosus]MDK8750107.1 SpaA isopeptide-forming pilin-related protein [Lacticaseibacillus rhamnosus]
MQTQKRVQKCTTSLSLLVLLLSFLMALVSPLLSPPNVVDAGKNITVSGFNSNDATITDINGNDVTKTPQLSKGQLYTLTYYWQIPDTTVVNAGDTAEFSLPATVSPQTDINFKIFDPTTKDTIASVFVKAGSSKGLVTFTDFFTHSTVGREGVLTLQVNGSYDDSGHQQGKWYVNKAGWVVNAPAGSSAAEASQYVDTLGRPKLFQWDITLNPEGKTVNNVVLQDTLDAGQKFDTSHAVVVHTGTYSQGSFQQKGIIKATPQINGKNLTLSLGTINTAIEVDLWTNPLSNSFTSFIGGINTWTNSVKAAGTQGDDVDSTASGKITWSNSGSGIGDSTEVTLTKLSQAKPQQPLSGAVFSLYQSDGKLVKSNLTTDKQGKLTVSQLLAGDYQFVETKAPAGYEVNSKPITFTISVDQPEVSVQSIDPSATVSSSSAVPSASKPSTKESKPSEQPSTPSKSSKPSERPSTPSKSSKPSDRPSTPSKSSKPSTRPSTPSKSSKPSDRPSTPSKSSKPSDRPSTPSKSSKPSTRPSTPSKSSKPSTRPSTPSKSSKPSTRPSTPSKSSKPSVRPSDPSEGSKSSVHPSTPSKSSKPSVRPSTPSKSSVPSATSVSKKVPSSQSSSSESTSRSSSTPQSTPSASSTPSTKKTTTHMYVGESGSDSTKGDDPSKEVINPNYKHSNKHTLPDTGEGFANTLLTAIGSLLAGLGSLLFFKRHK